MGTRKPKGLFAERLDHLFQTVHPEGRKPYTHEEVATAINEAAGERLGSTTYVWQLRTGESDNPTYKVIIGLARFFGVSPSYFFAEEDQARGAVPAEVAVAVSDEDVRAIAVDASGLSKRSLESVKQLIANARALEGQQAPVGRGRRKRPELPLEPVGPAGQRRRTECCLLLGCPWCQAQQEPECPKTSVTFFSAGMERGAQGESGDQHCEQDDDHPGDDDERHDRRRSDDCQRQQRGARPVPVWPGRTPSVHRDSLQRLLRLIQVSHGRCRELAGTSRGSKAAYRERHVKGHGERGRPGADDQACRTRTVWIQREIRTVAARWPAAAS